MDIKDKLSQILTSNADQIMNEINASILDDITERYKSSFKENQMVLTDLFRWKSKKNPPYELYDITKIVQSLSNKPIGLRLRDPNLKDHYYKFSIDVTRTEHKRDVELNKSTWKVRIVIRSMNFTYYINSKTLFCEVFFKIKALDSLVIVLKLGEPCGDVNLFETLNQKIANSRNRFVIWNFIKYDKNYQIPQNYYYFYNATLQSKVENGVVKQMNYAYHNDHIFELRTIQDNKVCKKVKISITPLIDSTFYVCQFDKINLSMNKVGIPPLLDAKKNKLDLITLLSKPVNDVFFEDDGKDLPVARRVKLRTLPAFGGQLVSVPSTFEKDGYLKDNGTFKTYYLTGEITKDTLNNKCRNFIKIVVDNIPLTGMYVGSDNTLFELCGKGDKEKIERDMLFLRTEFQRYIDSIKKWDISIRFYMIWAFLSSNIEVETLRVHLIATYFTPLKKIAHEPTNFQKDGTYVVEWERNTLVPIRDGINGFSDSNTLESGLPKVDYIYYYRLGLDVPSKTISGSLSKKFDIDYVFVVLNGILMIENGPSTIYFDIGTWKIVDKVLDRPVDEYVHFNKILITTEFSMNKDGDLFITLESERKVSKIKLNNIILKMTLIERVPLSYREWHKLHLKQLICWTICMVPETITKSRGEYVNKNFDVIYKMLDQTTFQKKVRVTEPLRYPGLYYGLYNTVYSGISTPFNVKIVHRDLNTGVIFDEYKVRELGESSWKEGDQEWVGVYNEDFKGKQPYSLYYNIDTGDSLYGETTDNHKPNILYYDVELGEPVHSETTGRIDWGDFLTQRRLYIGSCKKENLDKCRKLHRTILDLFKKLNLIREITSENVNKCIGLLKEMIEAQTEYNNTNNILEPFPVWYKLLHILPIIIEKKDGHYKWKDQVLNI